MRPRLTSLHQLYLRGVVCTAAGCCGFRVASTIARWLARSLFDLSVPARRIAAAHLTEAYADKLTDEQRDRLNRAGFEHFARFWVEAVFARRKLGGRAWRAHVLHAGSIDLQAIARGRRGAIFVSPYVGNPAVAAYVLGQTARPLYVVVDAATQGLLRQWPDVVGRANVVLLNRLQAARQADRILAAGAKLLMVGEHLRPRRRRPRAGFLGRWRAFYPTVALWACRCSVPIVVLSCRRQGPDFRFELRGEALIEPAAAVGDDGLEALTRRYVGAMEAVVLQCPEQYFWARRRDDDDVRAVGARQSVEVIRS